MSVILDALRKSEHERQRSAVPGLAQVPIATPRAEMPRWALVLIGALGAAVVALGAAWWQSTRDRAAISTAAPAQVVRPLEVPAPAPSPAVPPAAAPVVRATPPASVEPPPAVRAPQSSSSVQTLEAVAATAPAPRAESANEPFTAAPAAPPRQPPRSSTEPTLPSAAALIAQGFSVPPLRLELHAYAAQPSDRFVFINGRKYTEGQRTSEGPEVVAIAPNGAVLNHLGQRFLLSPE